MRHPQRLMVVLGTRPEAVKLAPILQAAQHDPRFQLILVNTGQHKEMLQPFLEWFQLKPHHTLSVMEPGQPLAALSGKLLNGLHAIMEQERPDIVMVQGDTTTALIGALAAYYGYDYYVRQEAGEGRRHFIQIAHVEAGLRTDNLYAPFPEEANRRLIGTLAHWHFAPTQTAADRLLGEGHTGNVYVTGNPVNDALLYTANLVKQTPPSLVGLSAAALAKPYVLITGHRRENYGEGFQHICQAIATLAARFPSHHFIYPVHLNRHVQGPVNELLGNIPNVFLTPPQDYPAFVYLMQHCQLLLTDSGGLQEEGPSLGKPVLVMRDTTERPEGIEAGTAKLVGTVAENIVHGVTELLTNPAAYQAMAQAINPYGDGHAATRILNLLAGESAAANSFNPLLKVA
ncbi:MAG: UDP-N-acetylglucosamine 2-epimerase (non-hydrolyzing) [Alphaproteobacteria bacterium]|nr:UDP-N-acetylglucosamine 2-epimerase (non-hydrolyzing) [Alphaproteobacteria bacterium]